MTLIRNIKGWIMNGERVRRGVVIVHFTSDNRGETLSLGSGSVQFSVNFKDIEKIVERERAKGYTNGHAIIDEGWGEEA